MSLDRLGTIHTQTGASAKPLEPETSTTDDIVSDVSQLGGANPFSMASNLPPAPLFTAVIPANAATPDGPHTTLPDIAQLTQAKPASAQNNGALSWVKSLLGL